jgi:hypothetical protein
LDVLPSLSACFRLSSRPMTSILPIHSSISLLICWWSVSAYPDSCACPFRTISHSHKYWSTEEREPPTHHPLHHVTHLPKVL